MKLKKIIASTMALLCFSSANMITYAVETDIEDDVYIVKSGIVTPLIPEDIALSTQIQIILSLDVKWEELSNGVLRVFSCNPNFNAIPDCCSYDYFGEPFMGYGANWPDSCTKLVIEDSIKTIGKSAFDGCSFDEVEIYCHESGTIVDMEAFHDTKINKLTVYGERIEFEKGACIVSKINTLDLSECERADLGECSFQTCAYLINILPPKEHFYIGESAFSLCDNVNISNIDFSQTPTYIEDGAFSDCRSIPQKVILPESIMSIGRSASAFRYTDVNTCVILNPDMEINDWNDDITIYGYKGSTAEEYVNSHDECNCIFIPLDDIKGDVKTDAEVNINDIVLLQKYLVKMDILNEKQFAAADINNDGTVNIFDLMMLKKIIQSAQ